MFVNWREKEVSLKIVYYGPGLSGKTTNLQFIHSKLNPQTRGKLVSLKTREDRTIFFDFLQVELGRIKGLSPKFNLYTVPGQKCYAATRKLALQGADGVVFVADSQVQRLSDNLSSYKMMFQQMRELGIDRRMTPCVVQYNKRDLSNCAPVALLDRYLAVNGTPTFEAVAIEGEGVLSTLKATIGLVMQRAQRRL
jgi:hypothetical protein